MLQRHAAYLRSAKNQALAVPDSALETRIERLDLTLTKLESRILRIAVFGLVSRGKSAVLNALLGEKILPSGPLNGVTQAPRSLLWTNANLVAQSLGWQTPLPFTLELIDTPGLDEIDGQDRAEMAAEISRQADLILFVIAGDITRTEYQALCELRQAQKPLLLVFNKIDLYPDQTRQAIYQNLQRLATRSQTGQALETLLSPNEIVLVAADPTPVRVRVELPNGKAKEQWEALPMQIDPLRQKIFALLDREGRSLVALNALFQARDAEVALAEKLLALRQVEAEALIWKFVRYKAIAVALNPIVVLDLIGGFVADLAMIRALSELYGLPVTRYEASKLWNKVLLSSGSLLLTELGSGFLLGLGKSGAAVASGLDASTSFSAYAGAAAAQGAIAGYGTYIVGRAIQVYLEQGASWGAQGASRVIAEILSQVEPNTILYRLRQELNQELGL